MSCKNLLLLLAVLVGMSLPTTAMTQQTQRPQTLIASVRANEAAQGNFAWTDIAVEKYTGTRKYAMEMFGWPESVQAEFLRMFAEDSVNEKARASSGTYYTTHTIPARFHFKGMMFGANKYRTNVVAYTMLWREGLSREMIVYRVEDPVTMKEYVFFEPKECHNASGYEVPILICVCPPNKPCGKKN